MWLNLKCVFRIFENWRKCSKRSRIVNCNASATVITKSKIGGKTSSKVKYGDCKVIRTSTSSFWAINQQILAPGKQNIEFSNFETSNCKLQLQVWIASSQLSTWKLISVHWVSDDWARRCLDDFHVTFHCPSFKGYSMCITDFPYHMG